MIIIASGVFLAWLITMGFLIYYRNEARCYRRLWAEECDLRETAAANHWVALMDNAAIRSRMFEVRKEVIEEAAHIASPSQYSEHASASERILALKWSR